MHELNNQVKNFMLQLQTKGASSMHKNSRTDRYNVNILILIFFL